MKSLALVHTSMTVVPTFSALAARVFPGWQVSNIVNEGLLTSAIRDKTLSAATRRRVLQQVLLAADGGADAVLVTCSSIGPGVDDALPLCSVPLQRVDLAMARAAVERGVRIGVLGTLAATLNPTRDLLLRCARQAGKDIELKADVCSGAFETLAAGSRGEHDRIVAEAIGRMAGEVDVIVLAQASMASVIDDRLRAEIGRPILTSPELGMLSLREQVDRSAAARS